MNPRSTKKLASGITDPKDILQMLFEISEAITVTENSAALFSLIRKSLSRVFDTDHASIALCSKEKSKEPAFYFPQTEKETEFNTEEAFWLSREVIQKNAPRRFVGADILSILKRNKIKNIKDTSRVWLGSPLKIQKKVIGAVAVFSKRPGPEYTRDDLNRLYSISFHIALAIERKAADETLAEQRQILNQILETSPVGIALVQNRVFKWVNNEMVALFGYGSKQELENNSVRIIYCNEKEYQQAGRLIYNGLSSTGRADYEINLVRKDKTCFPSQIRLTSADQSDPMAWTIATISDNSQRIAAEKVKADKEKLQGVLEMAEAISHEIDQPLHQIVTYLTCQQKKALSFEEIKNLKRQALKIGKITKRLTNITRYKTRESAGDIRMIDIWKSSS